MTNDRRLKSVKLNPQNMADHTLYLACPTITAETSKLGQVAHFIVLHCDRDSKTATLSVALVGKACYKRLTVLLPVPEFELFQSIYHKLRTDRGWKKATCILAATEAGGIGKDNSIPWNLPADMANFRSKTEGKPEDGHRNGVIMGGRTWSSLPAVAQPFRRRHNVVVSASAMSDKPTDWGVPADVSICADLEAAIGLLQECDRIFIVGGAQLYNEAFAKAHLCGGAHLTTVRGAIDCDVSVDMNLFHENFLGPFREEQRQEENGIKFSIDYYARKGRTVWTPED